MRSGKINGGLIGGVVLFGNVVNALAIVAGAIAGLLLRRRFSESMAAAVMKGIGLCVLVIGLTMALKSDNILIVIGSIVLGTITGELLGIERGLEKIGDAMETRFSSGEKGGFSKAFVTASLVYCVGAMAIMGALEAGLSGKYSILLAKSMLDGISAIIFTVSLGVGVVFSAIPVFLYQGTITLFAGWLSHFLDSAMIGAMSAVGGLLIVAIGLNILELGRKTIRVGNMLPSIVFAALLTYIAALF